MSDGVQPGRDPVREPGSPDARDVDPDTGSPVPDTPEPARDPLRGSRTGRAWVNVVALGLVLVLLIVFIAQNTRTVTVSFLGWDGRTPLAVALLVAAAAGLLVAAISGTLRIWQLRQRVRRDRRQRGT